MSRMNLASAALFDVQPVSRLRGGSARIAFGALIAFVLVVFACPGTVLPPLAPYLPAKGIALLALVALGVSSLVYGRRLYAGGWVGAGLAALLGIYLASTLWSFSPPTSLAAALELAKFVIVYLVVVNVVDSPVRVRILMAAIVIGSLIPTLGALKNYALGENLVEGNRAAWVSTFGNPDELAYYLVVAVPLALALRERTRSRPLRLLLLCAVGLFGAGVFLSASRGGILTLAVVVLLWWVRELGRGRIGLWIAFAVLAALAFVPAHVWDRTETLAAYQEDVSAMGRIWTMQAGWKMFLARPFSGLGAGTFVQAFPGYAPLEASGAMAAHNSFIQVLAEGGLGALAGFLVALGAGLTALRRAARGHRELSAPAWALGGAMLAFVMSSLTGGIALSWPIYWVLGMAAALPRLGDAGEPVAHG
jgi:O-antigen ligase